MKINYATIIFIATIGNAFLVDPWWVGSLIGLVASLVVGWVMFVIEKLPDNREFFKALKESDERHRRDGEF